jgi:hypothetical protein
MISHDDITMVARALKTRLGIQAFLSLPRKEITGIARVESGQPKTRIKVRVAGELEQALLQNGVRCFPSLVGTTTDDMIRLFHIPSVSGDLLDLLLYPSPENDRKLGEVLVKIKGRWH